MSTRPKAIYTAKDVNVNQCPMCNWGFVSDDELRFYKQMAGIALERFDKPSLSVRGKLILVGIGLGLVGGAACMWIFMQLFG